MLHYTQLKVMGGLFEFMEYEIAGWVRLSRTVPLDVDDYVYYEPEYWR
jgi:hypothetical protein